MALLIGLPLKIFHFLFVLLRLAWPVVLVLLALWLIRRRRGGGHPGRGQKQGPSFDGPVYTVDYEEVEDTQ